MPSRVLRQKARVSIGSNEPGNREGFDRLPKGSSDNSRGNIHESRRVADDNPIGGLYRLRPFELRGNDEGFNIIGSFTWREPIKAVERHQ